MGKKKRETTMSSPFEDGNITVGPLVEDIQGNLIPESSIGHSYVKPMYTTPFGNNSQESVNLEDLFEELFETIRGISNSITKIEVSGCWETDTDEYNIPTWEVRIEGLAKKR